MNDQVVKAVVKAAVALFSLGFATQMGRESMNNAKNSQSSNQSRNNN